MQPSQHGVCDGDQHNTVHGAQKTTTDNHCNTCTRATAGSQNGLCRHTWVRSKTGSRCTLAQRGPQLRRNIFIQSSYLQTHACIKSYQTCVMHPNEGPFRLASWRSLFVP